MLWVGVELEVVVKLLVREGELEDVQSSQGWLGSVKLDEEEIVCGKLTDVVMEGGSGVAVVLAEIDDGPWISELEDVQSSQGWLGPAEVDEEVVVFGKVSDPRLGEEIDVFGHPGSVKLDEEANVVGKLGYIELCDVGDIVGQLGSVELDDKGRV